jgi:hypothetical protein
MAAKSIDGRVAHVEATTVIHMMPGAQTVRITGDRAVVMCMKLSQGSRGRGLELESKRFMNVE